MAKMTQNEYEKSLENYQKADPHLKREIVNNISEANGTLGKFGRTDNETCCLLQQILIIYTFFK